VLAHIVVRETNVIGDVVEDASEQDVSQERISILALTEQYLPSKKVNYFLIIWCCLISIQPTYERNGSVGC
jgi:hypothetical protein